MMLVKVFVYPGGVALKLSHSKSSFLKTEVTCTRLHCFESSLHLFFFSPVDVFFATLNPQEPKVYQKEIS